MNTLTSTEAAQILGVQPGALRMLVHRGKLNPVRPGAHPLRFRPQDVWDLQIARRTQEERAELTDIWARVDDALASQVSAM